MTERYLNQKTCAERLGISVVAFQRWGVRPVKRKGRENLYSWPDVVRVAATKQRNKAGKYRSNMEMPACLADHGGNVFRLLHWELCRELCGALQRMLSGTSDMTPDEKAGIAVAVRWLPAMFDIWLSQYHDKWFAAVFQMDIDDLCSQLLRLENRVPGGPPLFGDFYREVTGADGQSR